MKLPFTFVLLFVAIVICAQPVAPGDNPITAIMLHNEGMALLNGETVAPFDRVRALAKFRGSQRLLQDGQNSNPTLRANNEKKIAELQAYFSEYRNSDSLLNSTRFYPDSVFQADVRYNASFKQLITDLLSRKRNMVRRSFFRIEGLNEAVSGSTPDSAGFILSFDQYWPQEIMQFESAMRKKENELDAFSGNAKAALLYAHYQRELDSLINVDKIASADLEIENLRLQQESTGREMTVVRQQYSRMRILSLGLLGLSLLGGFYIVRRNRKMLRSMQQNLLEEKKRSDELLLNILPAEVAKKLKTRVSVNAHKHELVSVLFSDFQRFSQIAEELPPEELVKELDICFSGFDRIMDKHRLQKIKTIGDAYMCAGGLYTRGNNHLTRIILAALEIQKFMEGLQKDREAAGKLFFQARIGIHAGPVVSGVVGTKKFAFDIWGHNVNIAQQMEAHGAPGKVNISGVVYEMVKEHFVCTHRGRLNTKNNREYDMYFVEDVIKNPPE